MSIYYDYRGQYSRLNQQTLFGHHREWTSLNDFFDSTSGGVTWEVTGRKLIRFKSMTFKPGWKIIKLKKGEKFKDPTYRKTIQNAFNIQIADSRDIVEDPNFEYTIFAGERFIGTPIIRIEGKRTWDDIHIECANGKRVSIPKTNVVNLEVLKV